MEKEIKKIFQDDEGNPVVFFFRPCAARSKVQPVIEEHGGKVTAKIAFKSNAIKLANDDDFLVSDDYYSVRLVEDSVKAKMLVNKEKYRLQTRKSVLRDDEQVSDISFDEEAPLTIKASSKYFQGRKMYSYTEDMAILKYIINNGYHDRVSGNAMWKEMETLEITKHSSLSMNTRYRKIIRNNLNLYSIPLKHKKKLSEDYVATSDDAGSDSSTEAEHEKEQGEDNGKPMSKSRFSKNSPQNVNSPAKLSGEDGKRRTHSQNPAKLLTSSPSPKKMVSTRRSKYFDGSSDDSADESDTIPTTVKTKKMKLKFTSDNEQPPSENATQKFSPWKTSSKKSKNAEISNHDMEKDCSATDDQYHAEKKNIKTSHSGKSKEKSAENGEEEINKQSVEFVKRPVGRPRKEPLVENEKSPRKLSIHGNAGKENIKTSNSGKSKENDENKEEEIDKQSVEFVKRPVGRPRKESLVENGKSPRKLSRHEKEQWRSLGTPSKSRTESPQNKLGRKNHSTTESLPKVNEKGKLSISDSPKSGHSCEQSDVQKKSKKSQKTLYNSEAATLTPSVMENSASVSKTKFNMSPSSLYKSEGVKKSSRYEQHLDAKASTKRKSLHARGRSSLDDSVYDFGSEDDFDKELMKRVGMTSTQVTDDEAPSTSKKRRFAEKRVVQDASENTPVKKNTRKTSAQAKSRTSYVTMFNEDEEDTVTEIATDRGRTEDSLDDAETEDLILNLCRAYQLTKRQVVYILYINNGDVNNTLQWLRRSGERKGRLTWNIKDDEKLDGDLNDLFRKYGEPAVQERILFLDQL